MRHFLASLFTFGAFALFSQNAPDFWQRIQPEAVVLGQNIQRQHEPLKYTAFSLDFAQLDAYLKQAPREFTAEAARKSFLLTVPMADGSKEVFAMVKTRVIDAALEVRHPEIGTYAGQSLRDAGMHIRITTTPAWGFKGFITLSDKGVQYIETVAPGQDRYYMAYDRLDINRTNQDFARPMSLKITPEERQLMPESPRFSPGQPGPGEKLLGAPVNLKVYKFACAAEPGFSQDNGGTKDAVFQKLTEYVNQLNAIYERDINIRLVLIPESYDIIFTDPNNNPYTGTLISGWMNQNPVIMLNFLGSPDKYDVGHVFARYIEGPALGIASTGSCCTQFKGRGCSGGGALVGGYGDQFFATFGQEIGHQWNSLHTFNYCPPNSTDPGACEPGSGITIMSYNGACGANNISGNTTSLYYHACSIAEIRQFVDFGDGATCGTNLATNNTAPQVSTSYPPLTFIPINTPFELNGTAVDMDGDPMTYTWDEIDKMGTPSPLGSPAANAPLFRWYEPTTSTSRTFPRIQTIAANAPSITEVLPGVNRDIDFVLVARDNKPGGGGISWDTVSLRATTLAGPFLVTYPNNTGVNWKVGEYQTIIWDVANTDKAPVSCKTVNIRLSLDNGITYPVTLASGVPNNGKYCIQVPNNTGANMRVRVDAADNVFFDISNNKFTISQPSSSFSICTAVSKDFACLPGNFSTTVSTAGLAGFNNPITLSATGLPNGATATFSPNPVQPGNSSTMTVSFAGNTPESTFDVTVQGTEGALNASSILTLSTIGNNFSTFGPSIPANGAAGVIQQPVLRWTTAPDADFYEVEVATNPSFAAGTVVTSKQNISVDSFQVPVALTEGALYYWHVRPVNDCGPAAWSETRVFVVAVLSCATLSATDLPKPISANGTPTVESKVTINSGGTISDVNVKKIQGSHTFFKDLEVHLIGPSGTDVLLWKDKCANNVSFNVGMDDAASGPFACPPPNNGQAYKPAAPLAAFNGQNSTGVWTLRVKDNVISSGGSLAFFDLEVCSNVALDPPAIVVNQPLVVPHGASAAITESLLKAQDANNGPAELRFTLMSLPVHGELTINGVPATLGAQYTQADINNGGLRYYDYGLNLGQDQFNFSLTDGNGGLASGTFVIQPTVGTHNPVEQLTFAMAPNPATDQVILSVAQPLSSEARVRLHRIDGQLVKTWTMPAGTRALVMETGNAPSGLYVVSLEYGSNKGVQKLIIR